MLRFDTSLIHIDVNLILSCQHGCSSSKRLGKGFQKARPLRVLVWGSEAERVEEAKQQKNACGGGRVWEKGAPGISPVIFVYGCFRLKH